MQASDPFQTADVKLTDEDAPLAAPRLPDHFGEQIKQWGEELGFADIGITHTNLSRYEADYFNWIGDNFHGEMAYMAAHGSKRTRPAELVPGTASIISVRLNYLDLNACSPLQQLHQTEQAYVSRYALGRDYHKLMRKRLQQLAQKIEERIDGFAYRAFCDSAPVLERPIAEQAGLGFIGKNSLLIHPRAGSWFFLGELYTNLPLPADPPFEKQGCGPCTACIQECPTQAILDNGVVDARRCISYLTIEYSGTIPLEFRSRIGNRIYGCDDCQLVCPWNKFTSETQEPDFKPRHELDRLDLLTLWQWQENDFVHKFEGSPIRRIGYAQWKRNLAIALGNIQGEANLLTQVLDVLEREIGQINELVDEHIFWAQNAVRERLKNSQNLADNIFNRPGELDRSIQSANHLKPFKAPKYYLPKSAKPKNGQ